MALINWPARPTYPILPASPTADDTTAYYQKCQVLTDQYLTDVEAYVKSVNLETFVQSKGAQDQFLGQAMIAQLAAGRSGATVLTEAVSQLNALKAYLNIPAPIKGPV